MKLSSPKVTFDGRLLEIERLLLERLIDDAANGLSELTAAEFEGTEHELGLYYLLSSECNFYQTKYKQALAEGLRAARHLADSTLNRRYGRVQWTLSKTYSALGDLKNGEIRARDAVAAFRRASDEVGLIDALNELARIAFIRNDYEQAIDLIEQALALASDNPRKRAQLTGNIGRIRIQTGAWDLAETELKEALKYAAANKQEASQAANLLSLGKLHFRRRQFHMSGRRLDDALEIICRLELKREQVIHLEYAGELAFEKGDLFKAKTLLSSGYQKGLQLAPESALVSQTSRHLAEVELALDNIDEAMKYAQKSYEVALPLGEKSEIGLAKRVIAQVFAARSEYKDALEHISEALDIVREEGDPFNLARTLLVMAEIKFNAGGEKDDRIIALYDEAYRIFKKLKVEYWMAETDYRSSVFACHTGQLASGFKKLSRAERLFSNIPDKPRLRAVHKFLTSLADQAVALSVSPENEFKVFGNMITADEYSGLKSDRIEDILQMAIKRTNGNRAAIYSPEFSDCPIISSVDLTPQQQRRFAEGFNQLLGEEIFKSRPTIILDCRRDPYINEIFADFPEIVASVIVVPFKMSDGSTSYLYLEKLSTDNSLMPFGQAELNFVVGFTDLIAFKWAELQKNKLQEDNLRLKNQLQQNAAFPNILTRNAAMLDVLAQVRQVVNSSISISIEGDTGTGKDLLAQATHYNSERRDKRFISVNCAALPETLLESELFGYKRGAFTGADRDKAGLFEEADGGTFFLDEIADMPLSVQAKILRVLEAKEIVRLGDTVPRKIDVRIISATNKDLKVQMANGLFRQDLYYRLSALTFRLPSLKDRREDIPLLTDLFLEKSGKKLSADVLKAMLSYSWPGNVRELQNEIMKMVLLTGDNSNEINSEVLSSRLKPSSANGSGKTQAAVATEDVSFSEEYSLYDYLANHERRFIIHALQEKDCVKKHAAALLNIPESTLRLKIKQYDIDLGNLSQH